MKKEGRKEGVEEGLGVGCWDEDGWKTRQRQLLGLFLNVD